VPDEASNGQDAEALQTALQSVRERENRWLEMSAELSADGDRMEKWKRTTMLQRLEVERTVH
jgi:hypothetical protein